MVVMRGEGEWAVQTKCPTGRGEWAVQRKCPTGQGEWAVQTKCPTGAPQMQRIYTPYDRGEALTHMWAIYCASQRSLRVVWCCYAVEKSIDTQTMRHVKVIRKGSLVLGCQSRPFIHTCTTHTETHRDTHIQTHTNTQ